MKPAKLIKLLYVQVLMGLVLGIAVGHWWPEFGAALKPPNDIPQLVLSFYTYNVHKDTPFM